MIPWYRQSPVFTVAIAGCALVAVGLVAASVERALALGKLSRQLARQTREAAMFAAVTPAPTPENAALIAADADEVEALLAAMRAELDGRGAAAGELRLTSVPEKRPDAFFDIATFVERMRLRAQQLEIAINPDERFGFAEFANVGPEPDAIPTVFRERLAMQFLLEALFDARPQRLIAAQRAQRSGSDNRRAAGPAADLFELDPAISARVAGLVETTAFRLIFTGGTGSLRALLNKLATFQLPVVVRAIEVDRIDDRNHIARDPADPVPLIARSVSRFSVTVELLELPVEAPAS